MSLILALLVRDKSGNQEIFLASDGRSRDSGTNKVISEDVDKIRKLTPLICIGYVGKLAELFEDVLEELKNRIPEMKKKDFGSVTSELKQIILEIVNSKDYREIEEESGPIIHRFIIAGVLNNNLRINILNSKNSFKIRKEKFNPSAKYQYCTLGPTDEVQQNTGKIIEDKLVRLQKMDDVVRVIRYIINEAATMDKSINDHIFIRRLSRNFDLEKYKGYEHRETPEAEWKEK